MACYIKAISYSAWGRIEIYRESSDPETGGALEMTMAADH